MRPRRTPGFTALLRRRHGGGRCGGLDVLDLAGVRRAQALALRERRDALGRGGAAELGAQAAILLGQLRHRLLPRLPQIADAHRLDVERRVAEERAGDRKPGEQERGELAPAPPVPLAGQVQVLDPLRLRVGGCS